MKKVMIATAILAMGFASVKGDSIASSSIVGYKTVSISAGQLIALGVVFENTTGGNLPVKDVVKVGAIKGGGSMAAADQIWRWNSAAGAWIQYYYYSSRGTVRWTLNGESVETTDTIPAGETFFYRRSTGTETTTLSLSGAVKSVSGSKSATVSAGQLAFLSNPWPISLSIKDFNNVISSGTIKGGGSMAAADQIWLWDTPTGTWTQYYYYSSRGTVRWTLNGASAETEDQIPAGTGFFFRRSTGTEAITLEFTYPSAN